MLILGTIASTSKYLLVIAGPTAVGKTSMAIELALHYHTEILSADSRQFYRRMDIGTAKPEKEELQAVKHQFIDTREPDELYGAGHFEKDAIRTLSELFRSHDLVIAVGGSGLYLNALMEGVDDFEEVPAHIREELNALLQKNGKDAIAQLLLEKDPEYYAKVDRNNPQRMIRALEVCLFTGKPFSGFLQQKRPARDFTLIPILLTCDRNELYQRINTRVDEMMKRGLLEEVRSLLDYKNKNALKTVGYKELFDHLEGKCNLEVAVNKIKQHTRNYAKRQLTWFRSKGGFEVFDRRDKEKIIAYIDMIRQHD